MHLGSQRLRQMRRHRNHEISRTERRGAPREVQRRIDAAQQHVGLERKSSASRQHQAGLGVRHTACQAVRHCPGQIRAGGIRPR